MKTQNDTTAQVRMALANADKTKLTLTKDAIMALVVMFVEQIFDFIKDRHKTYTTSREELTREATTVVLQKAFAKSYNSDFDLLNQCYKASEEHIWARVNKEEGLDAQSRILKSEQPYTYKFFFSEEEVSGGEKKDNGEKNLYAVAQGLSNSLNYTYGCDVSPREVQEIIFQHLWHGGDWAPLKTYKGDGSIFSWIKTTARREVINQLKKQGRIKISKNRSAGNTRLNKISKDDMEDILENESFPGWVETLLRMRNVDGLSDEEIMAINGWDEKTMKVKSKKATKILQETLINSPLSYKNILKDKEPTYVTMTFDSAGDFIKWFEDKPEVSPFKDIFGPCLSRAEIQEIVLGVMNTLSENLKHISDRDRIIWKLRFIEEKTGNEVAEELGIPRLSVDQSVLRVRKKFNAAAKAWYENITGTKIHETTSNRTYRKKL